MDLRLRHDELRATAPLEIDPPTLREIEPEEPVRITGGVVKSGHIAVELRGCCVPLSALRGLVIR